MDKPVLSGRTNLHKLVMKLVSLSISMVHETTSM